MKKRYINAGDASYLNLLRLMYTETPEGAATPGKTSETPGSTTSEGTVKTPQTVTFTPEQQKYLDDVILPRRLDQQRRQMGDLTATEKAELASFRAKQKELEEAQAEAERKKAEEQGEYQKLIQTNDAKWQQQLAERDTRITQLTSRIQDREIDDTIASAVGQKYDGKLAPNALESIKLHFRHGVKLFPEVDTKYAFRVVPTDDNGGYAVKLVDEDGNTPVNNKAQDLSGVEAMDLFIANNPAMLQQNLRQGSGAPGSYGGVTTKAQLDAALIKAQKSGSQADRLAYMKLKRELEK